MSKICLTLLCPPTIEEQLLDLLLMSPSTTVFTSRPVTARGLTDVNLSPSEQVMGRSLAAEVKVIIAATDQASLLDSIRQQFAGTGMRYWTGPVIESGEIA